MKNKYPQEEQYYQAQIRVRKLTRFYGHLFVYAILLMLYVLKEYFGAPLNFFPIRYLNDLVMSIWTLVIAIKFVKLFFAEIIFDAKWEQNKIEKIMRQDSENQKWK